MSDIIEEFLAEFLAQDTKEDGFATLVDGEGHPYVANLNPKEKSRYEETKKPLSQVKKEKGEEGKKEPEAKKTEEKKKPESEQDLTKAEIKKKLKNLYERAKKELHKELRKKRERTTGEKLSDEEIEKSIKDYEKYDNLKYVSDKPIFRLMSNLNNAKKITPELLKDVKDFFGKNQLSMDSADFAEIQTLLNELDNGNNGLDLFINNVNEEKVQNLKKTIGIAQDSALTSYFEDIEIY